MPPSSPRASAPATAVGSAPAPCPRLPARPLRHLHGAGVIRRLAVVLATVSTVLAGALGASIGLPSYAQAQAEAAHEASIQTFTVAADVPSQVLEREDYTVTEPPVLQWPVPVEGTIASYYGGRAAPCDACSSFHRGVDFTPGEGTTVVAIAKGVVVETDAPNWSALGVHVTIEHVIDGELVHSVYGHLQYGSMTLRVGDTVYSGQPIGRVGSTGASTGAHLHFEIRPGGGTGTVDPLAWMRARL